jgi:hypothetical protein
MFIIVFNQIFQGTKPFYTTLFAEEEEEEEEKENIMQQQATNKQQQQQTRDCFRFPLKELRFLFVFCVCERDRKRTTNRELQCLASTLHTCLI